MKEAFTAPFTPECCPSVTLGTGLRSALVLTGTGKIPYSTLVGNELLKKMLSVYPSYSYKIYSDYISIYYITSSVQLFKEILL